MGSSAVRCIVILILGLLVYHRRELIEVEKKIDQRFQRIHRRHFTKKEIPADRSFAAKQAVS